MPEINEKNQIVIEKKNGEKFIFDFNLCYKGYYPFCHFTAVAVRSGCIYVAGIDESGTPHLFVSLEGLVWEEKVIESRFRLVRALEYGKIQNILMDSDSELIFLVTENGYLVILPDCPKCVRVQHLSDIPVTEGWIEGDSIYIRDIRGKEIQCFRKMPTWYRCAFSYAIPHLGKDGMLLDFREEGDRRETPISGAIPLEEDKLDVLLKKIPSEIYLFFVCERGYKADEAAALARSRGYEKAYSLGGIGDVLLDMHQ